MPPSVNTLLIVSHVVHYREGGQLYAYAPYAREIDIWADLFPRVVIAAPCRVAAPPGEAAAFSRGNITIAPQPEQGGSTLQAKLALIARLPATIARLAREMRQADAIHVRCPGNLGLVGVLIAPLFSQRLVAKFAGQWNGGLDEAWTVRLQRALLRSRWWRGPVTVYGEWPGQPAHVTPFFTSVLEAPHMDRARRAAVRARRSATRVLFVGRLSKAKNVDVLLTALAAVRGRSQPLQLAVVGDGPERARLEAQAIALGLGGNVTFHGGVGFDRVIEQYEDSDVLVLASDTEGWPKAITEAMAFGLVCIGSDCGLVPRILGDGRGVVVPARDAAALADRLYHVASSPADFADMRARAAAWAQQYSIDHLRTELGRLLAAHWGPSFRPRAHAAAPGQA